MIHSPYIRKPTSVRVVMFTVLLGLVPGTAAHVWQIGSGVLVNMLIASIAALLTEALVLRMRGRPVAPAVGDLSAIVTAALIALCFPPIAPWWMTALAASIAILAGKQLYGGLGQNPFNPAMVAYCATIVAYPALMSQWPPVGELDFVDQLALILGGAREVDGMTGATALDSLKTGLRVAGSDVDTLLAQQEFGLFGGRGWEWIAAGHLVGGLFLLARGVITWHMPAAFIAALALISGAFWLAQPAQFAPPLFHLASGGSMLAAFFIVTDPVSGATTPRGKLMFAAGVAVVAYLIRVFGAFPDGIAFAVLLMNMCVPLIDMKTQRPVFGHKGDIGR